jgi:hypothetical protein
MDPRRLLDELQGVASKIGLIVRTEALRIPIRSQGGLCRLKGQRVVLLDERASVFDRSMCLAEALAELGAELDNVYMAPEARQLVDAMRGSEVGRKTRPHPKPHK